MKEYIYVGQRWFGDEWEGGYSVVKAFKTHALASSSDLKDDVGERTYIEVEVE